MKLLATMTVALLAACAQPAADAAPTFAALPAAETVGVDLLVWPADPELRAWVLTVAPRIEAATGLVVAVSDSFDGVPMFWSSIGEGSWFGLTHDGPGHADWVAIEPGTPLELRETVVLHELLHALGAPHVGTGEGVLSPEVWAQFRITAADLESVCSVRECTTFSPEAI